VTLEVTPEFAPRKTSGHHPLFANCKCWTTPPEPLPANCDTGDSGVRCAVCFARRNALPNRAPLRPAEAEEAKPQPATHARDYAIRRMGVLYLRNPELGREAPRAPRVKKEGKELKRRPMYAVRQVVVCGNVQSERRRSKTLASNDIAVSYVNGHGGSLGSNTAASEKRSLREAQIPNVQCPGRVYGMSKDSGEGEDLTTSAPSFLMRSLRGDEGSTWESRPAAARHQRVLGVNRGGGGVGGWGGATQTSVESVLGIEGQGAAALFRQVRALLEAAADGQALRLHDAETAPAARPGEPRCCRSPTRCSRRTVSRPSARWVRPVQGVLPPGPTREPFRWR